MQIQPPNVVIQTGPSGVAVFPTVGVTVSQLVFWTNKDTQPHFPVPVKPVDAFKLPGPIAPGTTSNTQAPGSSAPALKQGEVFQVTYACSLPPAATGILEIVNDFYVPKSQLTITRNPDNTIPTTNLITGGKPNYTVKVQFSELPDTIDMQDGGPDGPQLTGHSAQPGTFLLSITVQDALSNVLTDTLQITIV
jgi:hypothetical protein